ncbi:hypothetical protein CW613_000002 [Vibrio mimicus]
MSNQITVPFHGSSLFIVEHNGEPYTPMKHIVEGMGMVTIHPRAIDVGLC